MADELQALAGHLLVVGGRAVRVPPPGALAETAPRRAARIREDDIFFILVTPAAGTRAPSAFFEGLAQHAADVYFESSGGITGGLREALAAINAHVLADPGPEGERRVDAVAAVLRGDEVYAARSGGAFGLLRQGADLVSFPANRSDPLVMNLPPLGTSDTPEVQLARWTVAPGQVMLLAGAELAAVDDAALGKALIGPDVPTVIEQLKPLADRVAAASVIQFAPPGADVPAGLAPGSRAESASPAPMRPRTSRTSSRPPIPRAATPTPLPGTPATPQATPTPTPLAADEPAPSAAPPTEPPPEPAPQAATQPAEDQPLPDPIRDAVGRVTGLFRRGDPDPARGPSALDRASQSARRAGRDILRGLLAALLAVTDGLTRLLDRVLPAPDEEGKQGIPTNVAVALAILIPVVIVVVVVGLALSEAGKTEFETYRERAQTAHREALALNDGSCDNPALRLTWVEVLQLAEQAEEFRPNDATVLSIMADAQNYLDCFDRVQRRDLTLLREFADNAELIGPIVGGGGVDLYTLDRVNGTVYHDTVDSSTGNRLTTRDNAPIIRRNQAIGPHIVGDLFDIEWLSSGGTAHDNVLIALDRDGVLVSYSPTFFASAQKLVTEGRWQNPVAIGVFRSNLYVMDTGANQVWRYVPPVGERRYSNAPEEYFNGPTLPDLAEAVDFGISDEGAIYILFADGTIRKYRRNVQGIVEEQPFNYQQRPAGAITGGTALFVDNDPASRQLYIVDAASETVYETLWGGSFQSGYRPRNMMNAFEDLTGFYADAVVRNNMYVVAGNRLYHFARTP